jgi:hypothetical protein
MAALSVATGARAADGGGPDSGAGATIAAYCGDAEMQCVIAPLQFQKKVQLPIAFNYDTGWIPDSFKELQVRFHVAVPAETVVKLAGQFKTTWPKPLTLATPGDRYSGLLKFDYGLIVEALAKIDVTVAGYHVTWQGPIPYTPHIDFHVLGGAVFNSWAYETDPVSASGFTAPVELFELDILALVADIPPQVAAGGLKLKVKGELKATYHTKSMNFDAIVTPPVSIQSYKTQDGTTLHASAQGPYVEYDVHPEGLAHYDGVLHLIPNLYVSVLGQDFDMPVYDFPVKMPLGDQDFIFDKQRIHVPLPDVQKVTPATVDFGRIDIGTSKRASIPLSNAGEAKARVVAQVDASQASIFRVLASTVFMDPLKTDEVQLRFVPKELGQFRTTLHLMTNDPDTPTQNIELVGEAVPEGTSTDRDAEVIDDDAGEQDAHGVPQGYYNSMEDSGCACGVSGRSLAGWLSWGVAATAAGIALRRRRRRK